MSRAVPPLRTVVLRIAFVAPLWGVVIACTLTSLGLVIGMGREGGLVEGASASVAMMLFMLVPALIAGYPIGLVVAFLSALLLVLVVRRFGWSRRNALLTACVPGAVLGLVGLVGPAASWVVGLGAFVTCVGAAALTWWSSLRRLLAGSSEDVAEVFA